MTFRLLHWFLGCSSLGSYLIFSPIGVSSDQPCSELTHSRFSQHKFWLATPRSHFLNRAKLHVQQPVGYSSDESGFLGACLLLSGIVAAIVTAPLFDRVFTHHLALTTKLMVPVVGGAWLSLIWAGKEDYFLHFLFLNLMVILQ